MHRSIRRLPDAELEVMNALWECTRPASRADIEEHLHTEHPLAATTVLTLLQRLSDKGFLRMGKQGRTNCYTPVIEKQDYLADTPSSAAAALPQEDTLTRVWFVEDSETYDYTDAKSFDASALTEYLSTLTVCHLYSESESISSGHYAVFYFGGTHLNLYDGLLTVNNFHDSSLTRIYTVDDEIDWDYIYSLCTFSN